MDALGMRILLAGDDTAAVQAAALDALRRLALTAEYPDGLGGD
jgi:hypothetical protein